VLSRVNAPDDDETLKMYRAGIEFEKEEYAGIFLSWEKHPDQGWRFAGYMMRQYCPASARG
jgi:hypothetical protein